MTAEPRIIRTEAEQAIVQQYEDVLSGLPGGERVRSIRAAAFDKFRRAGLPHRRIEEYKYTDLRALMKRAAPPARRPVETAAAKAAREGADPLAGVNRYRVVLVDGHYFDALSDRTALEAAGVDVVSARDALAGDGEPASLLLATPEMAAGDIALALNAAFATDGVSVHVRKGVALDRPLEIQHVLTAGEPRSATVRNRVVIGAGASVQVIETYRGPAAIAHQVNAVTEVAVGRDATLGYVRLQAEGDAAQHLGATLLSLSPAARVDHLTVTAGAALSRQQMFVTTGGEHARLGINAAGMIGGRQHADMTLLIDHALGGAYTRVLAKNVVDDDAGGVFQGKIIVEPDAQKTDAKMMAKSLLLSPTAEFDSKPELEIFADDVQCGHGATSGRMDDTQLFYLMTRGVPRAEADRLLIEAFLDEAIDAVSDERLAAALRAVVTHWLEKRGNARP